MKGSGAVEGKDALTLLVLGAVAGALTTVLVRTLREAPPAEPLEPGAPPSGGDLLRSAARKLQESRDRLVEAIDKTRGS